MNQRIATLLLGCGVLCAAGFARADVAGDKALAKVDAAHGKPATSRAEFEIINTESGKPDRKAAILVFTKGDKRLIEFTAPEDLKGTKHLALSPTEVYVYLPAYARVRRVPAHMMEDRAFGMAFKLDDLLAPPLAERYTGAVTAGTSTSLKVRATKKADASAPFPRIDLTIAKDKSLVSELRYFDDKGAHVRTETRSGYTCEGAVCAPSELKMVDDHTGLTTRWLRKNWKVGEPLSDDLFSKRSLQK